MYCLINGHRAIPSGSVKVTLENPRVSNSGEYTYDVSFPLDVDENAEAFGLMGRVDVSKSRLFDYDDCKLFGSNKLLIVGVGTVTGITDKELKLQIVGGKSSINYRLERDNLWIDQMNFPDVVTAEDKAALDCRRLEVATSALNSKPYLGDGIAYAGFTVGNTTTGEAYNAFTLTPPASSYDDYIARPMYMANLMRVMRYVFSALGYTVQRNVFETSPWDQLYIVHINKSKTIAGMLPHWKAKTLLDEFKLLFNANYIIDEINKTVSIVSATGITTGVVRRLDVADDFSMQYDDEGLKLASTDNLRYNLQQCDEPACVEEIDPELLQSLSVATYQTVPDMNSAVASMTDEQVLTTLFYVQSSGYFYFKIEDGVRRSVQCAYFQQLTREGNSPTGQTTTLRMVPAVTMICNYRGRTMICPAAEGPDTDLNLADELDNYITVEEILTGQEEAPDNEDSEDEVMPLAFLGKIFRAYNLYGFTDIRITELPVGNKAWSLSLSTAQALITIGRLHTGTPAVDRNHQMVYKVLLGDTIPSAGDLFIIRGHRYLCSKLELTVTATGIDSVATGYFNEILG